MTAERSWTPEGLAAREAAAGEPAWLEGDELTFVFRGAASAVCLGGGIQLDMHRLAEEFTAAAHWAFGSGR